MKQIPKISKDRIYTADVDITVEEWKEMLKNKDVFLPDYIEMVKRWYNEPGHMATSKTIMNKYNPEAKNSPYNGKVVGLATRIIKYLNRFEVVDKGKRVNYLVPFIGWYKNHNQNSEFVWKVRDELAQAMEELNIVGDNNLSYDENLTSYKVNKDGKKVGYYTTHYERNRQNREMAIKIHGTKCQACGFDFFDIYGKIGENFIEVHHVKPLHNLEDSVEINPETDLVCVCANCHRIIHRQKDKTLSVNDIKKLISDNKKCVN